MQLYMLDSRTEVLYVYSAAAAVSLDLYRGAVHQRRVAAELYLYLGHQVQFIYGELGA